jgi:hypothetical protein
MEIFMTEPLGEVEKNEVLRLPDCTVTPYGDVKENP